MVIYSYRTMDRAGKGLVDGAPHHSSKPSSFQVPLRPPAFKTTRTLSILIWLSCALPSESSLHPRQMLDSHVDTCESKGVTQRDERCRAFGGHDTGDSCRGQYISFLHQRGWDQPRGVRVRESDEASGNGHTVRRRLVADSNHVRRPVSLDVGESARQVSRSLC